MKKVALLFTMIMISVMSFGQAVFTGVNWIGWANEPAYDGVVGYAENPYETPEYTVFKAPASWSPVTDVASFNATWDVLGDAQHVAKPTDIRGGDLFDLETGNTFGASWKAVHDGVRMYILLTYRDVNNSSATPLSFEIMAQPKDPVRHQPTFDAGVADSNMAKKNMAYGRYVELGGGKAMFVDGNVTEYAASIGMTGQWGANGPGLEAFLDLEDYMFWDKTDGVVRAVLPMDFAGVLSYPDDPAALTGARTALKEGDVFAFDVKSNARVGGDQNVNRVEYFWAADQNNGYGSNFYSGHLTISSTVLGGGDEVDVAFTGVNWIGWANEPSYDGVVGYAENPYNTPKYTVMKAPASWSPVSDMATFDASWDVLGEAQNVAHATDIRGGDLFDLGAGNTFGSSWKAVHDGERVYILLKYVDKNNSSATPLSFEVMAQPKSPVRHEPTFKAGVADNNMAKKNMAYGRYVELGGGKAMFVDGNVTEYAASIGMTGQWGANGPGLEAFLDLEDYVYWEKADGVIRAVLPMDFAGVLSYPVDPREMTGERAALKVGDTFAFDVKSNARVGGDQNVNRVEYFWAADQNNGYGSNYYSGHLTISAEELEIDDEVDVAFTGVNWIGWANEPSYEGVVGYAENPYNNPTYSVFKAPASWTPVTDKATFDATWNVLGEVQNVAKPTDIRGGDLFDLGAGNTFGSSWKAVHDGERMYILLKYMDMNNSSATPLSFEVMAQPKSPVRHEPTFKAGVADNNMAKKNMAYGRYVELGGGKAMFVDGNVTEYAASIGMTGQWGANGPGLEAFLDLENYIFWEKADGVVRAVLPMDFAGVLSYPVDPREVAGARRAAKVGDVIAFDVKSNARVGGDQNVNRVEYFWAADQNNGYGSNYYSGHLTLSSTEVPAGTFVREPSGSVFSLYPNPARDYLTIVSSDNIQEIRLINAIGQVVHMQSVDHDRVQLNVAGFDKGLYLVQVLSATGVSVQRVLITR